MLIRVYKERFSVPGVRLMEAVWTNYPLSEICTHQLGSPTILTLPGINWLARKEEEKFHEGMPALICLHDGQGRKEQIEKGILFYKSVSSLADFIIERVDPDGRGALSALLRHCREFNGQINRPTLEEALHGNILSGTSFLKKENLPIHKISDESQTDFLPLHTQAGWVWAWHPGSAPRERVILALQEKRAVGKYLVPFFKIIKTLETLFPKRDEEGENCLLVYDGSRHWWIPSLSDLHPGMLAEMDKKGRMFVQSDFDIFPLDNLSPYALVRIPPRSELLQLQPALFPLLHNSSPPAPALARPAVAFDSHYPLPLSEDLEVLDDPAAALWLLSHTVRGVYLPGRNPVMFPGSNVPEEESFQVLARPRSLLS